MSRLAGSYPCQNVRLHSIFGPLYQRPTTTNAGLHMCGTCLSPASWMRLPVLFIDHHHMPICLTKSLPVAKLSPNVYCCYSPIIPADLQAPFNPSQRSIYSRLFFSLQNRCLWRFFLEKLYLTKESRLYHCVHTSHLILDISKFDPPDSLNPANNQQLLVWAIQNQRQTAQSCCPYHIGKILPC